MFHIPRSILHTIACFAICVSNIVVDPIQDRSKPLSCFKISSRSQQDREKLHYCFNFRGLPYTFLSNTFKVFLHHQQDCENVSECFIFLDRSYTLSRKTVLLLHTLRPPPTFSTKIELVLHIPYINVSVCYEFTKMLTRNLWNDHHLNDN